MTDGLDEVLLTAAKIKEVADGDLDGGQLDPHAGRVHDSQHAQVLSALDDLDLGALGSEVRSTLYTREATDAVARGDGTTMSAHVGVTEQDLDGSALRLPVRLLSHLHNNGAPAFVSGAGNPETGKTNLQLLLAELWSYDAPDDSLVIANFQADVVDERVTTAYDLAVRLVETRDRPKFVLLDEGSTHFDARTYSREVAHQFTPLAKRFAKIGVDVFGVVCHTGKDLHPEAKRLTTLAFYKLEKQVVDFYERWDADADMPSDRLFSGSIEELQAAGSEYSPDDSAPWSWNLRSEVFDADLTWPEFAEQLRAEGPVD